ncbi:ATP-binding protein [Azospirillum soli]|uniref:ATP-binding protein n=1 Tax=Azospirillum soli TaxID=1304799 RepID=UPI001AE1256F|nr:ATP-binding protein [Azospirillum soli]MBP2316285.1 signal transduction histidine kinase/CheY-like chemotaxis protein/HPt (histidine-containing phosphotransfer) domain-containing protein [Azospirillum soli]
MSSAAHPVRTVALGLLFALCYYGAVILSVKVARLPEANWTVIWFSSGVGLLCVRTLGSAGLGAIAAASMTASFVYYSLRSGLPLPVAALAGLSTTALDVMQVWLAGRADRRFGRWDAAETGEPYGRLASYLFWVCLIPPLLTCPVLVMKDPLIGIGGLSPDGSLGGIVTKLFIVVTGNALGLFLLGPLAVVWERRRALAADWRPLLGMLAMVPLPILLSTVTIPHVAILALAVALVVAVRHGLLGSVLAMPILTLTTAGTVVANAGPFPADQSGLTMFGFALVIVVLGLTFHFVGLAVDALAHQQGILERQVAARTSALEAKSAELAAVAERKTLFLGWLSHEVRTPLNAVLGMVRLMRRDGPGPGWDRRLDIAEGAGRHLVHLLDDVLELSRLEADTVSLRPEPADPRALAGEVLAMLEGEAAGKGLRLSLEVGEEVGGGYRLDPLRLRQILLNLASNAVKFTPAGAVAIRIDVQRGEGGKQRLTFAVEDSGPGVSEHEREIIFDAYARAAPASQTKGVGLGLAIVRRIVEHMDGTVTVDRSTLGGASFLVSIPVESADLPPADLPLAEPPAERGHASLSLPPLPVLNILLVEDGPENRAVVQEWLAPGGHRVRCAVSGEEALSAIAEQSFDLILMDIRLAGMDGVEATRRIRALPDAERAMTPIIALTANASPDDLHAYVAAGIDEVLTKPLIPSALLDALARNAPSCVNAPPPTQELAGSFAISGRLERMFLVTLRDLDAALAAALATGDRESMGRIAHRLNGSAATYGYTALSQTAARLEAAALRPDTSPEHLHRLVADLRDQIAATADGQEGARIPHLDL